jgi:hypothetical protein
VVATTAAELGAETDEMAIRHTTMALFSVLAGCLAYMASNSYGDQNALPRIILAISFSIFIAILLISIFSKELSILLFIFALYHLFFFLLPGMIHLSRNLFPFFEASFVYGTTLPVSFLVLLYSISVLLGILVCLSKPRARSGNDVPSKGEPRPKSLLIGAMVLLAISIPCIAVSGFHYERLAESSYDNSPLGLILSSLPSSAMFLSAILTFYIMRRNSFFSIILFVITGTIALLLNFPLALTRFVLFQRVIVLTYLIADLSRVRLKAYLAVIAVLSIFTVFPTLDYFARGDTTAGLDINPLKYIAESGDLDGLQSMMNIYEMVQSKGISGGWQLLGAALSYVPREVWPTKAYPTGTAAAEFAGYSFTNLSAPLVSEIYVDFGVVGLAIIPFFIGWFLISVDRRAQYWGRQRGHIIEKFFFGGLIGYETIVLRGSLIAIISHVYLYGALIGLLSFICRPGRKRIAPMSRTSIKEHALT